MLAIVYTASYDCYTGNVKKSFMYAQKIINAPRYLHCLSLVNRIMDVNVHLCVCISLLFC